MSDQEKRLTRFPGGNGRDNVLGKRPPSVDRENSRLSASKIPRVPENSLQVGRAKPPALLPLPVNTQSQQFSPQPRAQSSRFPKVNRAIESSPVYERSDPWLDFRKIFTEVQSGEVTVAHSNQAQHQIVAIRKLALTKGCVIAGIKKCLHKNLVKLHRCYLHEENLYFIYDFVEVNLAEIQATPLGDFEAYQIAAVCQEVSSYSSPFRS